MRSEHIFTLKWPELIGHQNLGSGDFHIWGRIQLFQNNWILQCIRAHDSPTFKSGGNVNNNNSAYEIFWNPGTSLKVFCWPIFWIFPIKWRIYFWPYWSFNKDTWFWWWLWSVFIFGYFEAFATLIHRQLCL